MIKKLVASAFFLIGLSIIYSPADRRSLLHVSAALFGIIAGFYVGGLDLSRYIDRHPMLVGFGTAFTSACAYFSVWISYFS